MKSRIELALDACSGLTDEELAKRGNGSFAKMIERKRNYAFAARSLNSTQEVLMAELKSARKQLAAAQEEVGKAQALIAMLEHLDAPVTDTSQALELIEDALKKSAS